MAFLPCSGRSKSISMLGLIVVVGLLLLWSASRFFCWLKKRKRPRRQGKETPRRPGATCIYFDRRPREKAASADWYFWILAGDWEGCRRCSAFSAEVFLGIS